MFLIVLLNLKLRCQSAGMKCSMEYVWEKLTCTFMFHGFILPLYSPEHVREEKLYFARK